MYVNDYWFDFLEEMKSYWDIDKYLFLLIGYTGFRGKIPSVQFWGITFLFLQLLENKKIVFKDGSILTSQDAFNEMEDCYIEEHGGNIYLWFLQKKKYFGW